MSVKATRFTVAATALKIVQRGYRAHVYNRSTDTSVFLGPTGVTTSNGVELKFGESLVIEAPIDDVFAVSADSEAVHVLATRLVA